MTPGDDGDPPLGGDEELTMRRFFERVSDDEMERRRIAALDAT
jgi:hypothetical protein